MRLGFVRLTKIWRIHYGGSGKAILAATALYRLMPRVGGPTCVKRKLISLL